ncbi:MAG: DUF1598 domain-containing protein [Planctomycetaceae bacterium]|jgi:hypothetical protein|nr:DUF1598 domain-containing protein [Planctomycetaceae bacterium]
MSQKFQKFQKLNLFRCAVLGIALITWIFVSVFPVSAQTSSPDRGVYYGGSVVGGVEIDAAGLVKTTSKRTMEEVGKSLSKLLEPIPTDLNEKTLIRKISLKKLNAQICRTIENQEEFSDSIRYLGGLTAIRYLVVVPEENDIILVGPSESWQADSYGNVIGKTSGRPVFRLEDLLTVFRAWNNQSRPSVITCSIDPTKDALAKIAQVDRQFPVVDRNNVQAFASAQETAYGMNVVTLQGVPEQSRFAMILVIADYKMKQIGLGHVPSPVRNLPSYVSLIGGSQKQINPRFWLAPEYGTITHDSKKLTWQLSEVKVKALTDDEYIDSRSNSRQPTGKPDRAAINWCNKMTANYDALSKADPVFGDLKNCMELAITVALIRQEELLEKAGCKLNAFEDATFLKPVVYPVPKKVRSQATVAKNGRSFVVACGGVEVNPFITLQNVQLDSKIDTERTNLAKTTGNAWWSK